MNRLKDVKAMEAINISCHCWSRRYEDEDAHESLVHRLYEFREQIGRGGSGVVYKCIDRTTGEQFACKMMPATNNALNEIKILQNLRKHPATLKSMDHYVLERVAKYGSSKDVYVISELCDGDLQRFIDGYGAVPESLAAAIITFLVHSLQDCHHWNIIHRDVKPSSIFITNTAKIGDPCSWDFKLGNFDRSILIGHQNVLKKDNVGTLGYSAPEMLGGTGYSYEVDIWSAGAVLYRLLFGRTPFYPVEDAAVMYDQIQNTEPKLSDPSLPSISESAKHLVLGMLHKDRTRRFSCNQILNHPWILDNVELDGLAQRLDLPGGKMLANNE